MARRRARFRVPIGLQALVWLACVSAAVIITQPIHEGLLAWQSAMDRLGRPPSAEAYLAATHELPVGHVVGVDDVRWAETPGFDVDARLRDPDAVLGHSVRARVLAGDAFRAERLVGGSVAGLAALVPPGGRAISFHLSANDRLSGLVEPGDRVDLVVSLPGEAATLLRNAEVLSIDDLRVQTALGRPAYKPQVTLLTTPGQAARVVLALRVGRPKLVLRSEQDDDEPIPIDHEEDGFEAPLRTRDRSRWQARAHRKVRASFSGRLEDRHLPDDPAGRAAVKRLLRKAGLLVGP